MKEHTVVSNDEWTAARMELLAREKELTRMRDRLSEARRQLPWVKIDKTYEFEGPDGKETLADLFDGRSQLIVQHFMFGPDWEEGCPSCSFWSDNFNGIVVHLEHRDITFVAVAKAKLATLDAYKKRMGWTFKWVSSFDNDFNRDFHVSFTPEEMEKDEMYYNYHITRFPMDEGPGVSVFYKNEQEEVFHTYSCYARGLDILNSAYHLMDLAPKGRDEDDLSYAMAWLRRHDQYED
ncbi:MAG: DUF899 domain-containing protein [Gammaproteobacteria bacterium]